MSGMRKRGDIVRRAGASVALARTALPVFAAAALVVVAAPDATAGVTGLQASPGLSWGPSKLYGTTCTYTLTATVNDAQPVSFYDFDPSSTFSPSNYIYPANGTATVRWTPGQTGWHRIVAYQSSEGGPAINLDVGTGTNTGSACLVLS
ncbi:hypothetical protein AB0L82_08890 [Nocardia sp. NPDC052001]|uniref:hypothetical protein n=1 Tax=Nocardia sp. NPDC052001 TaxID=3154853 RepID=UPI00343B64F0